MFQSTNHHVDLNFRAINYSAEVYLNGHKEVLPKGMFRRHSIDVTDILNSSGENLLAVLVYPPDHPGEIPPEGGQGGDHEVLPSFHGTRILFSFSFPSESLIITLEVNGHIAESSTVGSYMS